MESITVDTVLLILAATGVIIGFIKMRSPHE